MSLIEVWLVFKAHTVLDDPAIRAHTNLFEGQL